VSAACCQDTSVTIAVTHILRYFVSSWRRVYACGKCSFETKVNYLNQAVNHNTDHFRASIWIRFASATKCHLPHTFVLWHCGWKLQHMCWHGYPSHVYRLASIAEPSLGPNLPDHAIVLRTPSRVWLVSIMVWFMFLLLLALSGCDDNSLRGRT